MNQKEPEHGVLEKSLNDRIDAVFRGIVFILLNFFASSIRVAFSPGRGCVRIIEKLYAKDDEQIRPYVFLFIALFMIVITPTFLKSIESHESEYEYNVYINGELQKNSVIRNVFMSIEKGIETKEILGLIICNIFSVSVFIVILRIMVKYSVRYSTRQRILEDCLVYIFGTQVLMIVIAFCLDRKFGYWAMYTGAGAGEVESLISSSSSILLHEDFWSDPLWLKILRLFEISVIFGLPFTIIFKLVNWSKIFCDLPKDVRMSLLGYSATISFVLLFDVCGYVSLKAAQTVEYGLRDLDERLYTIESLECSLYPNKQEPKSLIVTAIIKLNDRKAWIFKNNDFRLFIGAKRVSEDRGPTIPKRNRKASDRVGMMLQEDMRLVDTEMNELKRVFIEPQKSAVLDMKVDIDTSVSAFLKLHQDDRRCTLSGNDEAMVGAQAPIR